ncbi:27 kDa hemolymph protein-like [Diorhabda sublineata]|uniref:27 kDa hemolymph protein-like n=1 Tax=Diorhabda sublineata TaxID=1163346 RepID=UPI0024E0F55A|nr:27 kDa hemolymph protein-like [Diorhabda sublineata]
MKLNLLLCLVFIAAVCDALPSVPDFEDFEQVKQRCDKKAGNGTFDKVKTARDQTETCLHNLVDLETVEKELEEAKKTGSMDEVFLKYCKKRPQMKNCVKIFYDAFEPCLEEDEKNAVNLTANVVSELGNFACFKDGDRLAMFVAEGGVECIKSRSDGIQNCFNKTIKFNPDTFSLNTIPKLTVNKKFCDDLTEIQGCVVTDLEKCEESTPANIIEAVFKFIKKTVCKDITKRHVVY